MRPTDSCNCHGLNVSCFISFLVLKLLLPVTIIWWIHRSVHPSLFFRLYNSGASSPCQRAKSLTGFQSIDTERQTRPRSHLRLTLPACLWSVRGRTPGQNFAVSKATVIITNSQKCGFCFFRIISKSFHLLSMNEH